MTAFDDAFAAKQSADQNMRDAHWCYAFAEGAEIRDAPEVACYALSFAEGFMRRTRRDIGDVRDGLAAGIPPAGDGSIGPRTEAVFERIINRLEEWLGRLQEKVDSMKKRLKCP